MAFKEFCHHVHVNYHQLKEDLHRRRLQRVGDAEAVQEFLDRVIDPESITARSLPSSPERQRLPLTEISAGAVPSNNDANAGQSATVDQMIQSAFDFESMTTEQNSWSYKNTASLNIFDSNNNAQDATPSATTGKARDVFHNSQDIIHSSKICSPNDKSPFAMTTETGARGSDILQEFDQEQPTRSPAIAAESEENFTQTKQETQVLYVNTSKGRIPYDSTMVIAPLIGMIDQVSEDIVPFEDKMKRHEEQRQNWEEQVNGMVQRMLEETKLQEEDYCEAKWVDNQEEEKLGCFGIRSKESNPGMKISNVLATPSVDSDVSMRMSKVVDTEANEQINVDYSMSSGSMDINYVHGYFEVNRKILLKAFTRKRIPQTRGSDDVLSTHSLMDESDFDRHSSDSPPGSGLQKSSSGTPSNKTTCSSKSGAWLPRSVAVGTQESIRNKSPPGYFRTPSSIYRSISDTLSTSNPTYLIDDSQQRQYERIAVAAYNAYLYPSGSLSGSVCEDYYDVSMADRQGFIFREFDDSFIKKVALSKVELEKSTSNSAAKFTTAGTPYNQPNRSDTSGLLKTSTGTF